MPSDGCRLLGQRFAEMIRSVTQIAMNQHVHRLMPIATHDIVDKRYKDDELICRCGIWLCSYVGHPSSRFIPQHSSG